MNKTIKTISFTLLILSLGLVLSACTQEDMRLKEQENIKSQLEEEQNSIIEDQQLDQSDNQEKDSEEIKDEGAGLKEELDVSKWRSYKNEYFNLKFKYHNNWYFQRDNLNAENYIAVYGFSPSVEELNNKDYAIQLFILNLENNFNKDSNYFKEKEVRNKKYILISNNSEYEDILNLMFENLEIIGEETEE
jgi:hypothetical protein